MKVEFSQVEKIHTKIVRKISRSGHVYLPSDLIGKTVFVLVGEKACVSQDMSCDRCNRPLATKKGIKEPICEC